MQAHHTNNTAQSSTISLALCFDWVPILLADISAKCFIGCLLLHLNFSYSSAGAARLMLIEAESGASFFSLSPYIGHAEFVRSSEKAYLCIGLPIAPFLSSCPSIQSPALNRTPGGSEDTNLASEVTILVK